MKKSLILFLVAVMAVGLVLTACAPATYDRDGNIISGTSTTPEPVGKEMILVGQHDDIQVYKMIDSITNITCYVAINAQRYESASIFCIK